MWPRMHFGLLLMSAVVGGAVTACARRPAGEGWRATTATQVEESDHYGDDVVVGRLQVTAREAYLEHCGRRILVVSAPPMTAVDSRALMIRTAGELGHFNGKRIRAQGELQGDILWGAQITLLD